MHLLAELFFWLSFSALAHSYLVYPALLRWRARGRPDHSPLFSRTDDLPVISIIMSVYNEEKVIADKLDTLFRQDYPAEKVHIYIGSDCSTDGTDELITGLSRQHPRLYFYPFSLRRGKPGVINELADIAGREHGIDPSHLFLITDANVMLEPSTLWHLAKHFRDERLAVVDARMVPTGLRSEGISQAENTYISGEVLLKHREGVVWGKMIGPFGGCYALRSSFFSPIPSTFLVDDFYIAMRVFEQGGQAISDLDAVCYEAVSHEMREEYRRKSRISAGNFQNLLFFRHLWWPPVRALRFAFFSHKVLRWLGPFFLLGMLGTSFALAWMGNIFYRILFLLFMFSMAGLPLLDLALRRLGIHLLPIRGVRYFMVMNVALLEGFFKFIKGIKTNVWEPPKRN